MERYDLNTIPNASNEAAGVLRTANAVDEKNCGCTDAAITPSNLYNLLDFRKANTAYTGNDVIACPYHTEFLLKCVQAGTTSTNPLDTINVTKGQVITDGGVKWEVIAKAVIDTRLLNGSVIAVTYIDGTVEMIDPNPGIQDYIVESYRNGTEWYEVYKSGKVRQGGEAQMPSGGYTITFLKPFANTNYTVYGNTSSANNVLNMPANRANKKITSMDADFSGTATGWFCWVAEGQGA